MGDILKGYYSFTAHPFDPALDPKTAFDFKARGVSLLKELDVFRFTDLKSCFLEVGPFQVASETLRGHLAGRAYDPVTGDPPMILIQGAPGTGLDSMAKYAAYLVRESAPGSDLKLDSVGVGTDSQAKFLMLLVQTIESYMKDVPGAAKVFNKYEKLLDPKAPDLGYLQPLLSELKGPAAAAPGIILTIGPITYDRRDWISWLYKLLNPLNVLPILLTDDPRVAAKFDGLVGGDIQGVAIRLSGFTSAEGREFAKRRLEYFRGNPVDPGLFPYEESAVTKMFAELPEGRLGVKLFIRVLRGSLNRKVIKLAPTFKEPPPPATETQITWDDVLDSYKAFIGPMAQG